jgi:hypothetical protein
MQLDAGVGFNYSQTIGLVHPPWDSHLATIISRGDYTDIVTLAAFAVTLRELQNGTNGSQVQHTTRSATAIVLCTWTIRMCPWSHTGCQIECSVDQHCSLRSKVSGQGARF